MLPSGGTVQKAMLTPKIDRNESALHSQLKKRIDELLRVGAVIPGTS